MSLVGVARALALSVVLSSGVTLAVSASEAASPDARGGPADGSAGNTTVVLWDELPPGVEIVEHDTSCDNPFTVPGTVSERWSVDQVASDPLLGDDALRLYGENVGLRFPVSTLAELETFSVDAAGGHDGRGIAGPQVAIDVTVGGRPWRLTSLFRESPRLGWTRYDLTMLRWRPLDEPVGSSSGEYEYGTVTDFVEAHGDATAQVRVVPDPCDDAVQVDGLTWGRSTSATTYDLEKVDTYLSAGWSASAGRTWVSCEMRRINPWVHGFLIEGRRFAILARPYAATAYREVARARNIEVRPRTTTRYRCRFDGDPPDPEGEEHAPALSPPTRVAAPHRLSLSAVTRGRLVVASGRTSPSHPGTAVTLRARGPGQTLRTVAGVVRRDARYHLRLRLPPGRWRVVVVEGPAPGNTAGRSPVRTVVTR